MTDAVEPPKARRPPTRLEEVARAAGVSKSTVSRVINGEPYVSTKAREAVHQAIVQLGYSPNQAARTLAGSRANCIALVVSEQGSRVLADPFFAGVLRGVHAELSGKRVQLVLMMSKEGDEQDLVNYLCGGHVDGVLVISLHGQDPLPRVLADAGLPTVVGGRPLGAGGVPYVDSDNFNGAMEAAKHLVSLGRTRIATIAGPKDMAVGMDRLSGFKRALSQAGLRDDLVAFGDFTPASGAAAMDELLTREPALDAVFVGADIMAMGALQALHAQGKRVPQDVAVVGFDDLVLASTAVPPLTTVRQDVEQLGRTMTWRLMAELTGEENLPPFLLLPTSLVHRASA
ncbi:LacI family DNA-binding transcriptional regulator [Actinosynnema pretiosum subsp. pretiosum]|uniref:Transcriptional regulator, LacI family n=2 Tax=Actinosynnema TaxID=40566 RepID=C6WCX0_ACTMD|nr:LacI family DNA-binding transcriptional regulator [Actinosynnema mirum]ACU35737.1 transcriptional regulator, LacI family [Actinosynnema mirum DSM 43827]QUF06567.1 LacI family DNA-binding transcriptional regulator [Actinosynnema pretiosum subsp. pretiosum]